MNGGTCRDLGDEKYECRCSKDFEGDHCEIGLCYNLEKYVFQCTENTKETPEKRGVVNGDQNFKE